MPDSENEATYGLIMPFVLCASNGGPFRDEDFVAGVQIGALDVEMRIAKTLDGVPKARYLSKALYEQIDLMGMRFGFKVHTTELEKDDDPDGYYFAYEFERVLENNF